MFGRRGPEGHRGRKLPWFFRAAFLLPFLLSACGGGPAPKAEATPGATEPAVTASCPDGYGVFAHFSGRVSAGLLPKILQDNNLAPENPKASGGTEVPPNINDLFKGMTVFCAEPGSDNPAKLNLEPIRAAAEEACSKIQAQVGRPDKQVCTAGFTVTVEPLTGGQVGAVKCPDGEIIRGTSYPKPCKPGTLLGVQPAK